MRFLGIDYGEKRVGIALSDDSGKMAFPQTVLDNNKFLLENIKTICLENNADTVVLGESKNLKGHANPILKDILNLKEKLEKEFKLRVFLMPEYLTTKQAERLQGKNSMTDASAAAIILQSFLDKEAV